MSQVVFANDFFQIQKQNIEGTVIHFLLVRVVASTGFNFDIIVKNSGLMKYLKNQEVHVAPDGNGFIKYTFSRGVIIDTHENLMKKRKGLLRYETTEKIMNDIGSQCLLLKNMYSMVYATLNSNNIISINEGDKFVYLDFKLFSLHNADDQTFILHTPVTRDVFSSPELTAMSEIGKPLTIKAWIYSLGSICIYSLTGIKEVLGLNTEEIKKRIDFIQDTPLYFNLIRMVEKEVDNRYLLHSYDVADVWTSIEPSKVEEEVNKYKNDVAWIQATATEMFPTFSSIMTVSLPDEVKPQVLFLLGPPGIGKSSITPTSKMVPGWSIPSVSINDGDSERVVNVPVTRIDPDAVREQMPDFRAARTEDGKWWIGASEKAVLFREVVNASIQNIVKNPREYPRVIYEIVGTYPKYVVDRIEQFLRGGYDVFIYMLKSDASKESVYEGVEKRGSRVGRYISREYFNDAWDKSEERFNEIIRDPRIQPFLTTKIKVGTIKA